MGSDKFEYKLRWFAALTHLGDTWVLTALTGVVAAALWLRQQWRLLRAAASDVLAGIRQGAKL